MAYQADPPLNKSPVVRLQKRRNGRGLLEYTFNFRVPAVSVLPEVALPEADLTTPVFGIHNHDSARADENVVQVGFRPSRPVNVVKGQPAVGFERQQFLGNHCFAGRARSPGVDIAPARSNSRRSRVTRSAARRDCSAAPSPAAMTSPSSSGVAPSHRSGEAVVVTLCQRGSLAQSLGSSRRRGCGGQWRPARGFRSGSTFGNVDGGRNHRAGEAPAPATAQRWGRRPADPAGVPGSRSPGAQRSR